MVKFNIFSSIFLGIKKNAFRHIGLVVHKNALSAVYNFISANNKQEHFIGTFFNFLWVC